MSGPPLQLPGFYWDQERNRYFPSSSRPAAPAPPTHTGPLSEEVAFSRQPRKPDLWHSFQTLRCSQDVMQRSRKAEQILSSNYASTSRCKHTWVPTTGRIRAFRTVSFNGAQRRFIGDDQGWIYACLVPELEEQDMILEMWLPDLILHPGSEITSICISGSKCIATCLGPSARISVQDLNTIGRTSLLTLKNVHDIWAAHLEGSSLVIGADKRAIYLHDLDATNQLKYLETQSDVFSVYRHDNTVYTGARNGSITRFDLRLKAYGQKLHDDRFNGGARSTVLHLGVVNEFQLLTSQMNGELAAYDLRFSRHSSPLIRYHGHVNTRCRKLGISINPNEQFLYAAGEDCRIRGWSLNTGTPIEPPLLEEDEFLSYSTCSDEHERRMNNPFRAVFPNPVSAMQVTMERKGICLWAVSDEDSYRYYLGQQDIFRDD